MTYLNDDLLKMVFLEQNLWHHHKRNRNYLFYLKNKKKNLKDFKNYMQKKNNKIKISKSLLPI